MRRSADCHNHVTDTAWPVDPSLSIRATPAQPSPPDIAAVAAVRQDAESAPRFCDRPVTVARHRYGHRCRIVGNMHHGLMTGKLPDAAILASAGHDVDILTGEGLTGAPDRDVVAAATAGRANPGFPRPRLRRYPQLPARQPLH